MGEAFITRRGGKKGISGMAKVSAKSDDGTTARWNVNTSGEVYLIVLDVTDEAWGDTYTLIALIVNGQIVFSEIGSSFSVAVTETSISISNSYSNVYAGKYLYKFI